MRSTRGKKPDKKGNPDDVTNVDKMASKPKAEAQKKDTNDKTIPPEQDIAMTGRLTVVALIKLTVPRTSNFKKHFFLLFKTTKFSFFF